MNPREQHLKLVTDTFIEATKAIEPIYFQLPVAGLEEPKFLERVYCYELYHQMRRLWPNVPHKITGETNKDGHPWIYHGALDRSKPDFTIHVPHYMSDNLLVIEVKICNPTKRETVQDLRKLTGFCCSADYTAAYYLIYGSTEKEAAKFALRCRKYAVGDNEIDLGRIKLFNHAKPLTKAVEIAWPV